MTVCGQHTAQKIIRKGMLGSGILKSIRDLPFLTVIIKDSLSSLRFPFFRFEEMENRVEQLTRAQILQHG